MKLYPFKQSVYVSNAIPMGLFGLAFRQQGGFFESPGNRGQFHLLEHLMCKPFDHMREQLKALGVDHNASTADNQVLFWFSGLTESLDEVCLEIYDKITGQDVLWTKEAFENEKSTVLQEYGDTFNSQESGFYYNTMRKHYNYCGAIGYREDIEAFTYEDSLVRAKEFTVPSIICQVGKEFIDPWNVYNCRNTTVMGGLPITTEDEGIMYSSGKNPDQLVFGNYDLNLEDVPKDSKTLVGLLGNKPTDITNTQVMGFIMNCINGGLESPLYDEIREKRGLSYYSAGEAIHIGERCLPMFFASTSEDNVGKLEKVYQDFFQRDAKDVISLDRFNTCQKAYAVKRKMVNILPHSGARTTVLGDLNPFDGVSDFTYDHVINKYNELMLIDNYIPIMY